MKDLIKKELLESIKNHANDLTFPEVFLVDDTLEIVLKDVFLAAFSLNESSGGWNAIPKLERAYSPGGVYYTKLQRSLFEKYGLSACKSVGPFQIMYVIYHELGFKDFDPVEAAKIENQMPVVIKFFNKRIFNKAHLGEPSFLGMAGDAYNSGNYRDNIVPRAYITRLVRHYHMARQFMGIEIPLFDKPWEGNIRNNND